MFLSHPATTLSGTRLPLCYGWTQEAEKTRDIDDRGREWWVCRTDCFEPQWTFQKLTELRTSQYCRVRGLLSDCSVLGRYFYNWMRFLSDGPCSFYPWPIMTDDFVSSDGLVVLWVFMNSSVFVIFGGVCKQSIRLTPVPHRLTARALYMHYALRWVDAAWNVRQWAIALLLSAWSFDYRWRTWMICT